MTRDPSVASAYQQALQLALRIDDLIATARRRANGDTDGTRMAQALTGNLIDQLELLRLGR